MTGNSTAQSQEQPLSREHSTHIKAIAILLMVFHHLYSQTIDGYAYPHSWYVLAGCCKICVPIFAFLTGWAYAFNKTPTCVYSLKKLGQFFLSYWVVVLFCQGFASLCCGYELSWEHLTNELLPIGKQRVMPHCWYVIFFAYLMLLLPLLAKLGKISRPLIKYSLILLFVVGVYFCPLPLPYASDVARYSVSFLLAYYLAKSGVYKIAAVKFPAKRPYLTALCAVLLCGLFILCYGWFFPLALIVTHAGFLTPVMVAIAALLFIFCYDSAVISVFPGWLKKASLFLGKHSMNIWFLHGLASSSATKHIVQPFVYYIHNPLYVVGITIVVCLLLSLAITPVQQALVKAIFHR